MQKIDTYGSINARFKGREMVLNAFKSRIFSLRPTENTGLEILRPTQMLQRLPTTLRQVEAGNTSKSLQKKSVKSCILCNAWSTLFSA